MSIEQQIIAKQIRLKKLLTRRQKNHINNMSMERRLRVEIASLEAKLNK